MYEVWQTGVSARISSHRKLEAAVRACHRAAAKFRRSSNYNAGSRIGFEVRRADGAALSAAERSTVDAIDEAVYLGGA